VGIDFKTPGIHHIALRSTDLASAKRFYTQTLGFPVILEVENLFVFLAGSTAVGVRGPEAATPKGETFSGGSLNDPLGLTLAVNGDILTANGNDGNLVVTKPNGVQVETTLLDPAGAGVLFGLTAVPGQGVYFVDDGTNTLDLLH